MITKQIAGNADGPRPIRIGIHGDQMPEPKAVLTTGNTRYPEVGFDGDISYLFCNPDGEAIINIGITGVLEVDGVGVKGIYPTRAGYVEWLSGTPLTVY